MGVGKRSGALRERIARLTAASLSITATLDLDTVLRAREIP